METGTDQQDQSCKNHDEALKGLCRLCGDKAEGKGTVAKEKYALELMTHFDIDISKDSDSVHPARLCAKHKSALYRMRNHKKKTPFNPKVKITPVIFREHNTECTVCGLSCLESTNEHDEPEILVEDVHQVHGDCDSVELVHDAGASVNDVRSEPEISVDAEIHHVEDIYSEHDLLSEFQRLSTDEKCEFIDAVIAESDTDYLSHIASSVGKKIKSDLHNDAENETGRYKDSASFEELSSPSSWLSKANPVLVAFLDSLGNATQQSNIIRMRIVENVMKLTMPSLISRFAFLENSAIYLATGSKFASDVLGKISPGGCYKTVTNWLRKPPSQAQECPEGTVVNVFDNEQVIGRKSQITPSQTTPISVITNHAFIELNDVSIQDNPECKPLVMSESDRKTAYIEARAAEETHKQVHHEQLLYYVEAALEEVIKTHKADDSDHIDVIVKEKDESRRFLKCTLCGEKNEKRFLVCRSCNEREGITEARKLSQSTKQTTKTPRKNTEHAISFNMCETDKQEISVEHSRFDHVPSSHEGKTKLLLADPVFCNPNSLETVAQVLRKIGKDNGIYKYGGSKRHWTFICCDGLPYTLIQKLIDNAVICSECNKSFLNKTEFNKHVSESDHPNNTDYTKEFDWFYLQIGAGHYEMNLVRAFFELNWTPFLEALCVEMGFVTDSAKQYALRCKDTHKSYALLLVFHLGVLRELVTAYYRDCRASNKEATSAGFIEAAPRLFSAPNARYLFEQVGRLSQGIINHHVAVRRNNAELLYSSRAMTTPLFFGRSHPKYQDIWAFDELQRIVMTDQVRKIYDVNVSGTVSGNKSLGQGFDFLLEEKNRELKDWIPKGMPTDATWLAACRNINEYKSYRHTLVDILGITGNSHDIKPVDLEESIDAWRARLRSSQYIQRTGPHESIDGKELDVQLHKFVSLAEEKQGQFMKRFTTGGNESVRRRQQPVFITPEERRQRTSPGAQTKAELIETISAMIECLPDADKERFDDQLASVKKGRKEGLVTLYEEIANNF